ncbi:uncharacterized protein K441DRAFT_294915 [Cenococcum geophilum 1.58]|uniref:uncharacterized protein n=1 Tax=Cenococcum geophilum 1.58 TaxID=794803 RepID=UPI00358F344A|nr:hypothetical protein K441DRAFT_294915 [Cenococcum geophilum 1.58]
MQLLVMNLALGVVLLLSLQTPLVQAYYSSSWSPKPSIQQYRSSLVLSQISIGPCNSTLRDYRNAFTAPSGSLEASELLSICYAQEACVIDSLSSDIQANFQGAGVVLGIMPTLLYHRP